MPDLEKKKIVVVGLKRSGVALAKFLARQKAGVVVTDLAPEEKLTAFLEGVRHLDITFELGCHRDSTFETADLVILSPGVPHTIGPVKKALAKQVPVVGEVEFAYGFIKEPIVAVTGTNGKTTTTELLGKMLHHSGMNTFVGGNIGNPLIEYVDREEKADVVVVEVSSFQLDTIRFFRPKVGILLNITDDHLDRYDDFRAYVASKARLFENQEPGDTAILNPGDTAIKPIVKQVRSKILNFDMKTNEEEGAIIENDRILLRFGDRRNLTLDCRDIYLQGRHNMENIAASSLGALAAGGTVEGIRSALKQFKGLPHRLETVDSYNGVTFIDDSKATNVDAVKRAIETFHVPVVIIMGGRDKGGDFTSLRNSLSQRAKQLILLGEATELIDSALKGVLPIKRAVDMKAAVGIAFDHADPGDVVLLSPGCASFDMYDSYAMRGEAFKAAVSGLKAQGKNGGR